MLSARYRRVFASLMLSAMMVGVFVLPGGAATAHSTARSELLRTRDLPYGWTVHHVRGGTGVGCLAPLASPKALQYTARASITFIDNGNPPELTEVVATSSSPAYTYQRAIAALGRCHVVKGYFAGHRLIGSVHRAHFGHFGTASHSYIASASVDGALLFEEIVVVQTAHGVMALAEGNVGGVSTPQFEGFVALALHRLKR